MKVWTKFFLAALLFLGMEKLIRTQTDGFRIEKTKADFPYRKEWEVENPSEFKQQPYYFLGSGVQCYAFLSEDQTTVLKIFKHYHMTPSSQILAKIPLPKFLDPFRKKVLKGREKRMESIFSSNLIAFQELPQQTGVIHLNINPKEERYPKLTIYDKIGVRHTLDLNHTPFVLQRKADLIFSYLQNHKEETQEIIDSLFSCITHRCNLGIANNDPIVYRNFGIHNKKVVEIDVGSFAKNPYMKNPLPFKREVFYETLELREWIAQHVPELCDYFEQKLLEVLQI